MRFDIVTIFPKIFDSYFNESIIKRAQQEKLVKIKVHNLRDYTTDNHKTVDDRPYGGGFGMVLMVKPILKAVEDIKNKFKNKKRKVILLSAKGKKFNQEMASKFSKLDQLIIISGRYEGVDERIARHIADEEISIGEYVLTGGEIPAMAMVDSISRLIPGVREFLQQLKSIGIKTANITDLTAQIQFRKMVYFGLDEYFDYVVTSEEAGRDKPNIEPFKITLNKLKVDSENVWIIGDSPESDIYGAKSNFKMIALQKIHKGVKVGINEFEPDVSFNHYSELIALIDRW